MIEEIIKRKVMWYKIINFLGKFREPICSRKVYRETRSNQSYTSTNLQKLEEKGLIEYMTIKKETKKYWRLTKKGRDIYNLLLQLEELMK